MHWMVISIFLLVIYFNPAMGQTVVPPLETEYVSAGQTASVVDINGNTLRALSEGTSFSPVLLNDKGSPLQPGENPFFFEYTDRKGKKRTSPGVGYVIEGPPRKLGIIDTRKLTTENPFMPGMDIITPFTEKTIQEILQGRPPVDPICGEDSISTIQDVLTDFHSTTCNEIRDPKKSTRNDFLAKWDRFIESRQGIASYPSSLLQKAKEIDLVSRTVLYEAHTNWLEEPQGQCEWDIITLSMRNRAFCKTMCRNYGQKNGGGLVGVATSPSQYNIWQERFINRTYITSCFMRPDLLEEEYTNLSPKDSETYRRKVKAFHNVTSRVQKLLNASDDQRRGMFRISQVQPQSNPPKTQEYLIDTLKHYYHPMSMPQCYSEHYADTRYIRAGYVEYTNKDRSGRERKNTTLIRRQRVLKVAGSTSDRTSFKAIQEFEDVSPEDAFTYEFSNQTYPNGTLATDRIDEISNDSYTCTAKGVRKECNNSGTAPHLYRRFPLALLNDKSTGKTYNIQCRSPELCPNGECIEFGGACDPGFVPISNLR